MTDVVDLKSLNPKQLLKEFKGTQKDLNSKDNVKKIAAIKKVVNDFEYLSSGSCLIPFISSLKAHKKSLEFVNDALHIYLEIVVKQSSINYEENIFYKAYNAELQDNSSIVSTAFQGLVDILVYKEEVKKSKLASQEPSPNLPFIESMKRLTIKSFYYLIKPLLDNNYTSNQLFHQALAMLPNFAHNLCAYINESYVIYEKEVATHSEHPDSPPTAGELQALQNILYGTKVLVFVLRYDPTVPPSAIPLKPTRKDIPEIIDYVKIAEEESKNAANNGTKPASNTVQPPPPPPPLPPGHANSCFVLSQFPQIATLLVKLLQNHHVSIHALEIVFNILRWEESNATVFTDDLVQSLLTIAKTSTEKLSELTVVQEVPVNAKGAKDPKKDDKNKKGAPVVEEKPDPFASLDYVKLEIKRQYVVWLCLYTRIFNGVIANKKYTLSVEQVESIMHVVGGFSLNVEVWKEMRHTPDHPVDESIIDLLDYVASLIGRMAELSEDNRIAVCKSNGATLLLSLLQQSQKVFEVIPDPANPDAVHVPLPLDRIHKLRRVSEKAFFALLQSIPGNVSFVHGKTNRWAACQTFTCDTVGLELLGPKFLSQVLEISLMITTAQDLDASSRGIRILSSVLFSMYTNEKEAFKNFVASNASLLTSLCQYVDAGISQINAHHEKLEEISSFSMKHALNAPLLESFYHTLTLIEAIVELSDDNLKIVATTARLEKLSEVLWYLGPPKGVLQVAEMEKEIGSALHNPREYNWELQVANTKTFKLETVKIRPVILDIFTQVIKAYHVGRVFEGGVSPTLPLEPLQPLPSSLGTFEEASLMTISFVSEFACRVLLLEVEWTTNPANRISLQQVKNAALHQEVRDSSLAILQAISGTGINGIAVALTAVSKLIFHAEGAAKSCLSSLFQTLQSATGEEHINTAFAWKLPQFFSDIFTEDEEQHKTKDIPLTAQQILKCPTVWPFYAFMAAIVSVLVNPLSSATALTSALHALQGFMKAPQFQETGQPVMMDIFMAVFMQFGGGVQLASLLGRFGNVPTDLKETFLSLLHYIINQGSTREKFWKEWMESHKVEIPVDPKAKGKKEEKKKDDKKNDKKKDGGPTPPSVTVEIVYNLESTEQDPDPNRGPFHSTWISLLNLHAPDRYSWLSDSTLLISSVLSGLTDTAMDLLAQPGIDCNAVNSQAQTSLMIALFLRNKTIIQHLLNDHKANGNLVDAQGVPTIFYAISALTSDTIGEELRGYQNVSSLKDVTKKAIFGQTVLLEADIDFSHFDYNVCNADGNSVWLYLLGIGQVNILLSGYQFSITHAAYHDSTFSLAAVHTIVQSMIQYDADVNFCSIDGFVPFHIAAGRGDFTLLQLLYLADADCNALSSQEYHALHFVMACCPPNVKEIFDYLFFHCSYRSVHVMKYQDNIRTRNTPHDNELLSLKDHITKQFHKFSLAYPIIQENRLLPGQILLLKDTENQLTILQYLFAGPEICVNHKMMKEKMICGGNKNSTDISSETNANDKDTMKARRIAMALHVLSIAEKEEVIINLVNDIHPFTNMNTFHTAALLLKGNTPKLTLTDKQKRSKRVRHYASNETQLLEILTNQVINPINMYNTWCNLSLDGAMHIPTWTPLHAALHYENYDLIRFLTAQWTSTTEESIDDSWLSIWPLHFITSIAGHKYQISYEFAKFVLSLCDEAMKNMHGAGGSSTITLDVLLNGMLDEDTGHFPLYTAIVNKQFGLLQALLEDSKVNLNKMNPITRHTPLQLICSLEDLPLLRLLLRIGGDRVDYSIPMSMDREEILVRKRSIGVIGGTLPSGNGSVSSFRRKNSLASQGGSSVGGHSVHSVPAGNGGGVEGGGSMLSEEGMEPVEESKSYAVLHTSPDSMYYHQPAMSLEEETPSIRLQNSVKFSITEFILYFTTPIHTLPLLEVLLQYFKPAVLEHLLSPPAMPVPQPSITVPSSSGSPIPLVHSTGSLLKQLESEHYAILLNLELLERVDDAEIVLAIAQAKVTNATNAAAMAGAGVGTSAGTGEDTGIDLSVFENPVDVWHRVINELSAQKHALFDRIHMMLQTVLPIVHECGMSDVDASATIAGCRTVTTGNPMVNSDAAADIGQHVHRYYAQEVYWTE